MYFREHDFGIYQLVDREPVLLLQLWRISLFLPLASASSRLLAVSPPLFNSPHCYGAIVWKIQIYTTAFIGLRSVVLFKFRVALFGLRLGEEEGVLLLTRPEILLSDSLLTFAWLIHWLVKQSVDTTLHCVLVTDSRPTKLEWNRIKFWNKLSYICTNSKLKF